MRASGNGNDGSLTFLTRSAAGWRFQMRVPAALIENFRLAGATPIVRTESSKAKQAADVARLGGLVRVTPDLRWELKLAAIQRQTTVQVLMLEAVEVVLNRHDDSPALATPDGTEANKIGRQAGPTITRVRP